MLDLVTREERPSSQEVLHWKTAPALTSEGQLSSLSNYAHSQHSHIDVAFKIDQAETETNKVAQAPSRWSSIVTWLHNGVIVPIVFRMSASCVMYSYVILAVTGFNEGQPRGRLFYRTKT